jgi:hypothetical protein
LTGGLLQLIIIPTFDVAESDPFSNILATKQATSGCLQRCSLLNPSATRCNLGMNNMVSQIG